MGPCPFSKASCAIAKPYDRFHRRLILSAWGFAGLIGPIIVARAKDLTGSFAGMLPLVAVVLSASVILPFLTKKPAAPDSAAIESSDNVPAIVCRPVVASFSRRVLLALKIRQSLSTGEF
jgi:hypothetical protein